MKDIDLDKIFEDFDFEEEEEEEKKEPVFTGWTGSQISGGYVTSGNCLDEWMYRASMPHQEWKVRRTGRSYISYDYYTDEPITSKKNWKKSKSSNQKKNKSKYDQPRPTTNRFNDEQKLKQQHYPYKNNYKK